MILIVSFCFILFVCLFFLVEVPTIALSFILRLWGSLVLLWGSSELKTIGS